jgi:hypothetical protein
LTDKKLDRKGELMRLTAIFVKIYFLSALLFGLYGCGKSDGLAPSLSSVAPTLVSFAVTPATSFVPKNSNIQMRATGTFSDGSTQDISSLVSWTLDDTSVASINSNGLMSNSWTGVSGVRVVNVSAAYLSQIQTARISITVATLSSIYVNPGTYTVNPGGTGNVVVIGNFSDGSNLDITNSVTWSSSDSAVATASLGVVSGVSLGTATLTASYLGRSNTLAVTVSSGAGGGGTILGTGLKADYYDGIAFNTFYGTRVDSSVDFAWAGGMNNLGQTAFFSVRWSGQVRAEKSETYTIYTQSDDGVRVYIDGVLVIDNFTLHSTTENTSNTTFNWVADSQHDIVVEYFQNAGTSVMQLKWSSATTPKTVITQPFLYPAP